MPQSPEGFGAQELFGLVGSLVLRAAPGRRGDGPRRGICNEEIGRGHWPSLIEMRLPLLHGLRSGRPEAPHEAQLQVSA